STLTPDEVLAIERADALPTSAPPILLDWQARLAALTALPMLTASTSTESQRLVPARKAAQIAHFTAAVREAMPPLSSVGSIVDWCGGKGHLGRTLGRQLGLPVTVLEREAGYADEARALAERDHVE